MNTRICLVAFVLALFLVLCSASFLDARVAVPEEKLSVLRKFTRETLQGATDRQIVKAFGSN